MRLGARCALFLVLAIASAARADAFRLLDAPRDGAQARVDLIQQAERKIDAVYFLARNDEVALTALGLLREARRRGVTTRLVVDATFQHIPRSVLALLASEGVEVRVYHPLTLRHPTWTWRRMHEKVVVVDGARYITGGRNLANSYFGIGRRTFVDRDVFIEGISAAEADRHFEELWGSPDVATLHVRVSERDRLRAGQQLDDLLARLRRGGGLVALDTGRNWSDGAIDADEVHFLHDPLTPEDGARVGERLDALMATATDSIVIESPYVVPTADFLALLEKKRAEGVHVRILTNSLRSTDGVITYVAYLKYRRRLLRNGVEILEYRGPDILHAKSIVIDRRIAMVGSYNLDPRSRNLNAEAMCVATDDAAAEALLRAIDAHGADAVRVRPPAHHGQTFRIWAMRLLLPFIEPQL